MEKKNVELTDLVGKHLLDGVDTESIRKEEWEGSGTYTDASVIRFRLDGIVYAAIEDPSDGYRSSMEHLIVSDAPMTNTFTPIEVIDVHRTKGSYGYNDDVLELIDAKTGKVVLEVGTSNHDDYYPSFVGNFQPENMCINSRV